MRLSRRHLLTGASALAAVGLGGVGLRAHNGRYYDGPVSDHFDGARFVDAHGVRPKRLGEVLRWYGSNDRASWPGRVANSLVDHPPSRVQGDLWRISFIGHASLLIQAAGLNILIDPIWSERASPVGFYGPRRVNDPGIAFDALPPIDAVLVSHNHYDHLDLATLSRLARTHNPRVVTPLGNDALMRSHDAAIRAEAHDWDDRVALAPGLAVTLAPMHHWSARGLHDRNWALWAAFVIETPAGRIYHVADSGYGEGRHFRAARARYGPFRLAILPIGAYEPGWFMRDQHMNPQEAVQAFFDCGAERALGHHCGTFHLADEPIDAPVAALAAARAAAGLAPDDFRALTPGEACQM
ncbi:MAG TPA: MBL fold metallo-hydrolase [Xanthobacteraceae bacterium]